MPRNLGDVRFTLSWTIFWQAKTYSHDQHAVLHHTVSTSRSMLTTVSTTFAAVWHGDYRQRSMKIRASQ